MKKTILDTTYLLWNLTWSNTWFWTLSISVWSTSKRRVVSEGEHSIKYLEIQFPNKNKRIHCSVKTWKHNFILKEKHYYFNEGLYCYKVISQLSGMMAGQSPKKPVKTKGTKITVKRVIHISKTLLHAFFSYITLNFFHLSLGMRLKVSN